MTGSECLRLEPYFNAEEIRATGAKLEDVSFQLMLALKAYRIAINRPVWLIPGGLTTGKHEAGSYHYRPEGAVDFYHSDPVSADLVVEELLDAGFKGIGVYWNGSIKSFHADRRDEVKLWRGVKKAGDAGWKYSDLVQVP